MSFTIERMLRSKKLLRDRLAARPISEKLRMLDALRARALAIGDAKRMAKDVDAMLHQIVEKEGGKTAEQAPSTSSR